MEALLDRLSSEFDESEGWIRIVKADWVADDLRLSVSIFFSGESEFELWQVSCSGVVEESICSDGTDSLCVSADSPLLKPYCEPEVDLMFSGNQCAPALLLGLVLSSCVEIMGRAEYMPRFLNQKATVSGIASSGYGLLGRFPGSVAARILEVPSGHPIRVNALPVGMPERWTGEVLVGYPKLRALEVGASYVIAESFSAVRA